MNRLVGARPADLRIDEVAVTIPEDAPVFDLLLLGADCEPVPVDDLDLLNGRIAVFEVGLILARRVGEELQDTTAREPMTRREDVGRELAVEAPAATNAGDRLRVAALSALAIRGVRDAPGNEGDAMDPCRREVEPQDVDRPLPCGRRGAEEGAPERRGRRG